jgi:hypothetical protein
MSGQLEPARAEDGPSTRSMARGRTQDEVGGGKFLGDMKRLLFRRVCTPIQSLSVLRQPRVSPIRGLMLPLLGA